MYTYSYTPVTGGQKGELYFFATPMPDALKMVNYTFSYASVSAQSKW
jgi:hypothetical protein